MELTMAAQDDSTPWNKPPPVVPSPTLRKSSTANSLQDSIKSTTDAFHTVLDPQLHGRGYFSALGIVRRKPSRPDAPYTLSKSCSDKMALKQCTSLLSSITSLIISPANAYLSSVVVPESQYSLEGCTRAFSASGRMAKLAYKEEETGYSFKPFEIKTCHQEFLFSRRQAIPTGDKLVPSNISASWTPYYLETLIGGVLQGRKQGDIRGASRVCKSRIWQVALEISILVCASQIEKCLRKARYLDVKRDDLLAGRESVKEQVWNGPLAGWVRNTGDEEFYLQNKAS
jgi:tRNA-specific adenosine deaminase 1